MYVRIIFLIIMKITRAYRYKKPFCHHIITYIPKKFFDFQRTKCKDVLYTDVCTYIYLIFEKLASKYNDRFFFQMTYLYKIEMTYDVC